MPGVFWGICGRTSGTSVEKVCRQGFPGERSDLSKAPSSTVSSCVLKAQVGGCEF